MNVWRPVELALAYGARAAWPAFQAINKQFDGRTFQPKWATAPLMKRRQRTRPAIRLAPKDRFALPNLRPRSSSPDPFR